MSFWKRYIDYVKDNPEGYWFKRKLFGWGWTPVTWQGVLITLVFLVFIIWRARAFEAAAVAAEVGNPEVIEFLAQVFGAALVLIAIAWRTGEPPKWQWGPGSRNSD